MNDEAMDYEYSEYKNIDDEIADIEEPNKDLYIENHFETLKENLENIQIYFQYVMEDAVFVDKVMKSKNKM